MSPYPLWHIRRICVFIISIFFIQAAVNGQSGDSGLPGNGNSLPAGFKPQFESGFVQNKGQILDQYGKPNPAVKYLWNGNGLNVQLRSTGFSYDTYVQELDSLQCVISRHPKSKGLPIDTIVTKIHRVDIELEGANPNAQMVAENELESVFNYYGANDFAFENVRQFGTITYKNIYPGIDLQFLAMSGTDKPIEYNFIVHPGANPSAIKLKYVGADNVSLENGRIKLDLRHGSLFESIPSSWLDDKAAFVDVAYRQLAPGVFGFDVPLYNASQTLTIDPTPQFLFGTFASPTVYSLGLYANFKDVVVDQAGNVYGTIIVGGAHTNFSTTGVSYNTNNGRDFALLKFGSKGQLLAATYFGGGRDEVGSTMLLANDAIYLFGTTNSDGLQTAGKASYQGCNYYEYDFVLSPTWIITIKIYRNDVIFAKFNTSLVKSWAQYLGGCYQDQINGADVFSNGDLFALISSSSSNFPLTSGSITNDYFKNVIGKYNANGDRIFAKVAESQKLNRFSTTNDGGFIMGGTQIYNSDPEYGWPAQNANAYKSTTIYTVPSMVVKYNGDAVRQWATFYQDGPCDLWDIDVDGQDNIWIYSRLSKNYQNPSSYLNYELTTTPGAYLEAIPEAWHPIMTSIYTTYLPALSKLSADGSQYLAGTYILPTSVTQTVTNAYEIDIMGFGAGSKIDVDPVSGDVFVAGGYQGVNVYDSGVTPCAESLQGNLWYARFDGATAAREWQTTWGLNRTDNRALSESYGSVPNSITYANGKLYFSALINHDNIDNPLELEYDAAREEAMTSSSAWKRTSFTEYNGLRRAMYLGAFEEFQGVPDGLILTPSTLNPMTQLACINGLPQTIKGNQVKIQQPLDAALPILYQWQSADQQTGPWTNISGAKSRNYTPRPIATGPKYFRRLVQTLNEECALQTLDSSAVATLGLRTDIAPNADIDGSRYFLCPGNSITLEGSASGGSGSGYTYDWYVGGDTLSSGTGTTFTNAPVGTTVYTLRVTDSVGCFDIDQAAVEPVKANAGPDVIYCEASSGVQVGGTPIQGTTLISYQWDASTNLSCTDCPQPIANVTANTSFYLTTTVTRKDGSMCSTRDTVLVKLIPIPRVSGNASYAGPDKTICLGTSTTLGTSSVSNYVYKWSPSNFLSNVATNPTNYSNSSAASQNPFRYTLRARREGCTFYDAVDLTTVYSEVQKEVDVNCGPIWINQKEGTNVSGTVYTWEKTGGTGTMTILSTRNNGRDAYIKSTGGTSVTFRRKTEFNGVVCYSSEITLQTSCPCPEASIKVSGGYGCASAVGVPYQLQFVSTGQNLSSKKIKWSPSSAVNNDSIFNPMVVTTNQTTLTATIKDKFDPSLTCSYSIVINTPVTIPVFNATDHNVCPGTSLNLGLANNPSYIYSWLNTSGMADPTLDKVKSNPSIIASSSQQYIVKVTHITSGCYIYDTVNVNVPFVVANAGQNKLTCLGNVVSIGADAIPNTNFTYSWSPSNSAWTNMTNETQPSPELLVIIPSQTLILTVTEPSLGCSVKDTVVITGSNQVPLPTLTDKSICPGASTYIGGAGSDDVTYSWSPTTGLSCTDCPNPLAKPDVTTTYTLLGSGCSSVASTSMTVTVLPITDFSLTEKSVCPSVGAEIGIGAAGNPSSVANATQYAWSPITALSCSTCANPTASPVVPTLYELTIKYANGCYWSKSVVISPNDEVNTNLVGKVNLCPGETVELGGDAYPGSVYTWSPSTGLSCTNCASTVANPDETTTYSLTVTNGSCTASGSVIVNVVEVPDFSVTGESSICAGGSTILETESIANMVYAWTPGTGVSNPSSNSVEVNPTQTTNYTLNRTSLKTGCSEDIDLTIFVSNPGFSLSVSKDTLSTCEGSEVRLPVKVTPSTGNYSYSWGDEPTLDDAFILNPTATVLEPELFTITVTNLDNNCQLTKDIQVNTIPVLLCEGADYGDAPASFDADEAAKHDFNESLKMGELLDTEFNGFTTTDGDPAAGDDDDGEDDEDAVWESIEFKKDTTAMGVIVRGIINGTGTSARLVGWIDFNNNGTFDSLERSQILTVPESENPRNDTLRWTGINAAATIPGYSYLRIRLTTDLSGDWDTNPLPTGKRTDGEVEDYRLYIHEFQPYPDFVVAGLDETMPVTGTLSLNDDLPPGSTYGEAKTDPLYTNPGNDKPTVNTDGTFTFNTMVPGTYYFLVPVINGGDTILMPLVINILDKTQVQPPVAAPDLAKTYVNTAVTLKTLVNDIPGFTGRDLVPSSVVIVAGNGPSHGTVSIDPATGDITYTPNTDYVGTDQYRYTICDNGTPSLCSEGIQFINVVQETYENTIQITDDVVEVPAGTPTSGNVLDNDNNPSGGMMTVEPQTITTDNYTFTLNSDGSYTFTGDSTYLETVRITYIVTDENGNTREGQISFVNKASLSGTVWFDNNFNGKRDSAEKGAAGIVVQLFYANGGNRGNALTPVTHYKATTDSQGKYYIQLPAAGSYAMTFDRSGLSNAGGYVFTIPNIEGNTLDGVDSDPDTTGFAQVLTVSQQESVHSFDAGVMLDADGDYRPDETNSADPRPELIDPQGYIYCEHTGEILQGGTISITGPGNVYLIADGSSGFYQFFVDATGTYTIALTNPAGYYNSIDCEEEAGPLDVMGTQTLGDGDMDLDGFVDDYSCVSNPFYFQVTLTPGDFLTNNNFPLQCLDLGDLPEPYAVLIEDDGPRHAVLQTPSIYMGSLVDIEEDGQPDIKAGEFGAGDDGLDSLADDEDVFPIEKPTFVITVATTMEIMAVNTTSSTVTLTAYLDMNANGNLEDMGEYVSATVPANYSGPVSLTLTPPIDAVVGVDVGLRLRITSDGNVGSDGFAPDGEVEDYIVLIAGFDYGDLPESYNTSGEDNPPAGIVDRKLMLGTSVDAELDGLPGEKANGDDKDPGLVTFGTSTPEGDDENGVELVTPMVPGNEAVFKVNAINDKESAAVLQAWVDFNGNGMFESNEQLTTGDFATQGATVPVGGLTDAMLAFTVPADAKYYNGKAMTRFRLSEEGGLNAGGDSGIPPFGEVEDYAFLLNKVGSYVWDDFDNDGVQEADEPGLDSVAIALTWAGADGDLTTTGDNRTYSILSGTDGNFATGAYDFRGLIPGKYKIVFTTPANMLPTLANAGSQIYGGLIDSDMGITGNVMDLTMVMEEIVIQCVNCLPKGENGALDNQSEVNGFPDNQSDDTHDAGFWRPCCSVLLNHCCPNNPK